VQRPNFRKKKGNDHQYRMPPTVRGYFGKLGAVADKEAYRHFADHIKQGQVTIQSELLPVAMLIHNFLEWMEEIRSDATYQMRKRECNSFGRFVYGDRVIADIPALEVTGESKDHAGQGRNGCKRQR
jgi:hypothetical protein